ncbi:MAG: hypothetical protein K2W82_00320 [Candidatus Obscuribacterales bacterium]|nr:hypothetical protein [Candidatus Obscuribacterales bacterium]
MDIERRGPVTMGLLWITMVTFFPCVLIGFQWFKDGITLPQVLLCSALSCLLILLYGASAAQLGALSGRGYGQLNRQVFGSIGASLIDFNLVGMAIIWYGLAALFLAEALLGLFHLPVAKAPLAFSLGVIMACNNFFGFKGVANFARYFAAPMLLVWVCYCFCKAAPVCPSAVLIAPPTLSFAAAFTAVCSFGFGIVVWGNEADYWRYGKPKVANSVIPMALALCLGLIVFPATGWMLSKITGITDYAAATEFMNAYSFAGIPLIGALVLSASYFAANDSGLYGSSIALENLLAIKHKPAVIILAGLGSCVAFALSTWGGAKSLEAIGTLSGVMLPVPTVIVLGEWFLSSRVFGLGQIFIKPGVCFCESKLISAPTITLLLAFIFGIATSGLIPGTASLHVGVTILQTWLFALAIYVPWRIYEYRKAVSAASSAEAIQSGIPTPL